jgi:dTDP-4-dehydrorhamnose reductase
MSKGRILLTGASGFLGWNLLREPWPDWEWIGCSNRFDPELPGRRILRSDLTLPLAIDELLDTAAPDLVIHTAAITDLNACEANPESTRRINTDVPARLAQLCAERSIRLVFTSSDMVFDGRHAPYNEESSACPLNVYGQQKAAAEVAVLAACPGAAVCRMPLMFGAAGPHAHNFLPEWIAKLVAGTPVPLFTDEFRAPVSAAVALDGLRGAVDREISGILHLGGRERMSRYEFGELLCRVWGFDSRLLQATQRADLNFKAPRPADTFYESPRAWAWGYASLSVEEQLRNVKEAGHAW